MNLSVQTREERKTFIPPSRRDRPPCLSVTIGCLICSLVFIGACSSAKNVKVTALNAPGGSKPEAMSAVKAGNQAFAAGQWAMAKQHYEKAIGVQKTLAEAHYNLALTLDRLGQRKQAEAHYTEAANFAPGHQVIWNSRIYRRYGDVETTGGGGTLPGVPGLGGLGGIGGSGGSGLPPGGN